MIKILKTINPTAKHREKTWKSYADKMFRWLFATGYLLKNEKGWYVEDQGEINKNFKVSFGYYENKHVFIGDTSPAMAVKTLKWLLDNPKRTWQDLSDNGMRNGAQALRNLQLITNQDGIYVLTNSIEIDKSHSAEKIVWSAAKENETIKKVCNYIELHPICNGMEIAEYINSEYARKWSFSSKKRIGNSLKQWALWGIQGKNLGDIPTPIGPRCKDNNKNQRSLFD